MRIFSIWIIFISFSLVSCKSNTYVFVDSSNKYGVDFTKGKWLLNELECPKENKDELTIASTTFFRDKLVNRFNFSADEKGLLLAKKSYLNPDKTALKDLKKGTDFDFFINIVARKNKNELASVQLYQNEIPGTNESEVFVEIFDLNLEEVIFSEHVIGKYKKNNEKSIWKTNDEKSYKLIDNIDFNLSANKLLKCSLNKIFKKLDKTSIKN